MKRIHAALMVSLASVGLFVWAGCSTTQHKAGHQDWLGCFSPDSDQPLAVDCADYGMDRVTSDYAVLEALSLELDALADEMAVLKRTLLFRDTPYLSERENEQIELMLFRFTNARDALWDIVNYYRHCTSSDLETHTRGAIIGMSAGLKLTDYSSRFAALFHDQKDLIALLNTACPSYDIPAGTYDAVSYSVTSIDHLEQIDITWYLFCKELADPESRLSNVRKTDPLYRELIAQMDGLHANTHIQTEYVLHARRSHFPDLANRLAHSRIAKLGDDVDADINSGVTKTRGFVFKNVARIKSPTSHVLVFSDGQAEQIKGLLQPGDILLTYTAGYMSDVFLPGNFKHGITYIGTVEQRRQAGLTDELLMQRALSEEQGKELIEHVKAATTADGYDVNIVEAVAEGVVLHSLDKLLKTHINRLAVIRPRITEKERLDQLVLLMQYVGASYDFKFDFENDAYQCCTEVVYRTTNRKGSIDFSLVKLKGRWILAADDILRYYLSQNSEAFEFILLADQPSDPDDYKAVIHTGPEGLQSVCELMDIPPPEK